MNDLDSAVTIVLPAWNEEGVLGSVIDEVLGVSGLGETKVLVVDDGSTDATAAVVRAMMASRPRLHIVSLPHGGKDRALWHAMEVVDTPWMGMMDSDGQYVPSDFPRLLQAALGAGADACWGVRARRSDHPWRLLCSRVARAVKRRVIGRLLVDDPGCGIWVARTNLLRPVAVGERDPAGQLHCHLAELIAAQGGRVTQIPIEHRHRAGGRAKYGMLNRLGPGSRSLAQARRLAAHLASLHGLM